MTLEEPGDGGSPEPKAHGAALIFSLEHTRICDRLPANLGRSSLVHGLILAYGLHEHLNVITPQPASEMEMTAFHARTYVRALRDATVRFRNPPGQSAPLLSKEEDLAEAASHGLVDDCPIFQGIWPYCQSVVGGTLTAARALCSRSHSVVMHWDGGRHHARRAMASGFCYVNDIVLGILELRKTFSEVLYIDIDAHHGDGVENAFYHSRGVLCVSFHKFERGFFPGTGDLHSCGEGDGHGRTVNVPLHSNIGSDAFVRVFNAVVGQAIDSFRPEAIVMQCGTDGLGTDKVGALNLSSNSFVKCVESVLSHAIPTLLLGGGGYNHPDAARVWTQLTAVAAKLPVPTGMIPEHNFSMAYQPYFLIDVPPRDLPDENSDEYLDDCIAKACSMLRNDESVGQPIEALDNPVPVPETATVQEAATADSAENVPESKRLRVDSEQNLLQ